MDGLAIEDRGVLGCEGFRDWLEWSGLSIRAAAALLGVSKDTVVRYRDGEGYLPRTLALAVWALRVGDE